MERGEDVDDDEIECITTKYARVLNPRPMPGVDIGAEEEVLDPEIQIPQLNVDVDDDKIECITTKYARVLNPRPIPGIDIGAEEEVLDPEIQIPQLKDFIPPQSFDKVVDLSKTALNSY